MKLLMPCLMITTCLTQLLNLFLSLIPEQIPNNFRICPLPPDIYDLAAQLAALDAVTKGTTVKQACYWGYCQTYLKAIELDDDPFLSTIS